MLRPLRAQASPLELLVGLDAADDAAVWLVAPDRAIIGTLDFFPPIVDDAYASGAIAAANALSDVYAMGGEVLFALQIAAWPEDLPLAQLEQVFAGAVDIVREAGGVIAGGHTVTDREPKFGLAVTGQVHPDRMLLKGMLRAGDALWLTKPLGTGILTTAHKAGTLDAADLASAVSAMTRLNRGAAQAAVAAGLHAGTDVTGFSLAGHASEMAAASRVGIRIEARLLPLLPAAREHAAAGAIPGGTDRNREHFVGGGRVRLEGCDLVTAALVLDPQTSGGLLLGVPAAHAEEWERERAVHGVEAWRIGEVLSGAGVSIVAG